MTNLDVWYYFSVQSDTTSTAGYSPLQRSPCSETPQVRKMHPPRSPASSCSSSTSSSRRSIRGNEDSKPHIPTAGNKLKLKKNTRSLVVPFNYSDNSDDIMDDFENGKEFEDMSLIRRQLQQIENQQSNLLELLQVVASFSWRRNFVVHRAVL